VDSKFADSRSPKLAGWHLLLFLSLGSGAFFVGLDLTANELLPAQMSLFVPFIMCALAVCAAGQWTVPMLRRIKAGQFIREDGPQRHLKKAGTPTMGGIFFIPVGVATAAAGSGFHPDVIAVSALTLAYGAIGWLDDWQILRRKSNKGISPQMKLALQVGFAVLFCMWLARTRPDAASAIALPLGLTLSLGWLFWPLAAFVQVAESNATNLTDGVDGLMGGLGAIAFLGMAAHLAPTSPELTLFCVCLSGSCLGFVTHNRNPAKVFMGDTGSLAIGGIIAVFAIVIRKELLIPILCGIFLAESLSVMIQVAWFRRTRKRSGVGRRIFLMAPLHHHYQMKGYPEPKIVTRFWIVAILLAVLSVVTLKIR